MKWNSQRLNLRRANQYHKCWNSFLGGKNNVKTLSEFVYMSPSASSRVRYMRGPVRKTTSSHLCSYDTNAKLKLEKLSSALLWLMEPSQKATVLKLIVLNPGLSIKSHGSAHIIERVNSDNSISFRCLFFFHYPIWKFSSTDFTAAWYINRYWILFVVQPQVQKQLYLNLRGSSFGYHQALDKCMDAYKYIFHL